MQAELRNKVDYIKGLLRQLLLQSDVISSFRIQNLKLEIFSTVKENVNENSKVHLIQPTIVDEKYHHATKID